MLEVTTGAIANLSTRFSTLVYLQMDYYNSQWLNSPVTLYTSLT